MKLTKTFLSGIFALLLSLVIMSCKNDTKNEPSSECLALEKADKQLSNY